MAVIHPRTHWGAREVELTWVPETTSEIVGVGRRMLAEGLGMLAFVFIAGAAIIINNQVTPGGLGLLGMATATGLAYALMVFTFHPISGGHINPAITIAEMFARRMPPSIAALYIGAQLVGAVVGALALEVAFQDFVGDASAAAALSFNPALTGWIGGTIEGVLTFVLVVTYFRAFVDNRLPAAGSAAVGLVVLFSFLVAFSLTGGALNVARVFGTGLVAGEWTDFGWYLLGLVGGAVAGLTYEYLFRREEEATEATA
jgi:glycerol uptake facilitator-like aquaporin